MGTAAGPEVALQADGIALLSETSAAANLFRDARGFCYYPAHPPRSWRDARRVSPQDLLAAVRTRGLHALSDLLPPFAAIVQTEPRTPVLVATDAQGLQHVYSCTAGGRLLVSNSALLLAAVSGAELDADAVMTFLRIGHYLGADSPFRGVTKLLGGEAWQIAGAARTSVPVPASDVPEMAPGECVRACVRTLLEPGEECMVELSGGLDSRLIVAALGRDDCRGRRAVTLGTPDAADVQIAERLARDLGFVWQFVDLRGMSELRDTELLSLVRTASSRCDHTTQPLARAVLEWTNTQIAPLPRFSGQNGELARGFYYPGFGDSAEVTETQVSRLLHWRLSTNDSIERDLVHAEFWNAHERRLQLRLLGALTGPRLPWLAATDDFYLRERMQRWVGVAYSAESEHHALRAPFFDPRVVAMAQRLRPAEKRNSRMMARLVEELAPALADVATAAGMTPRTLGSTSLLATLRQRAQFAKKVLRKVSQRVTGVRRSPVGAPEIARRLLANGACGPDAFERVGRLDWIRGETIGQVLARGTASWATLGQLLALEWTLETLERARQPTR